MLNSIRDWLSAIVPAINLLAIIYAAVKVLNRAERDYNERGIRIDDFENRLRKLEEDRNMLVAVNTKMNTILDELERVRTRLDKVLDKS